MKTFRIFAAALGMVAVSVPALAQSPLADAARREAARRQAGPSAAIPIYTNQDLDRLPLRASPMVPRLPGSASTVVTTAGVGGDGAPGAVGEAAARQPAPGSGAGDEKQWRARITAARSNLSRAEIFAEALQSRINALSADFVNRDDPAQRQDLFTQRQRALEELDRVQAEVAGFRQEVADIEEDARRAGVPPGWLR